MCTCCHATIELVGRIIVFAWGLACFDLVDVWVEVIGIWGWGDGVIFCEVCGFVVVFIVGRRCRSIEKSTKLQIPLI